MLPTFHVWAKWDDEVRVWYTAETTIRGLNSPERPWKSFAALNAPDPGFS